MDFDLPDSTLNKEEIAAKLNALVELVVAHTQRQPILLAVDELHWVDPTTRDFLGLLVDARETSNAQEALVLAHADFVKCGAHKYIERAHALATKHDVTL